MRVKYLAQITMTLPSARTQTSPDPESNSLELLGHCASYKNTMVKHASTAYCCAQINHPVFRLTPKRLKTKIPQNALPVFYQSTNFCVMKFYEALKNARKVGKGQGTTVSLIEKTMSTMRCFSISQRQRFENAANYSPD